MPETFFTGDQHLDHAAIIKLCRRPFNNLVDMNEALVRNWNELVSPRDTVYILGDIAWRNWETWPKLLKGHKILLVGNHDKVNERIKRHYDEVHSILHRRINGQTISMCHYAMRSWPGAGMGAWNLYGHSHGKIEELPYMHACDVGVDVWGYRPVPYDVIKAKMDSCTKDWPEGKKESSDINRSFNLSIWPL